MGLNNNVQQHQQEIYFFFFVFLRVKTAGQDCPYNIRHKENNILGLLYKSQIKLHSLHIIICLNKIEKEEEQQQQDGNM